MFMVREGFLVHLLAFLYWLRIFQRGNFLDPPVSVRAGTGANSSGQSGTSRRCVFLVGKAGFPQPSLRYDVETADRNEPGQHHISGGSRQMEKLLFPKFLLERNT